MDHYQMLMLVVSDIFSTTSVVKCFFFLVEFRKHTRSWLSGPCGDQRSVSRFGFGGNNLLRTSELGGLFLFMVKMFPSATSLHL